MPIKRTINGRFVYLSYQRESYKDFEQFKRELDNSASLNYESKDIIVDFTGSSSVTSPEIGELVRLLKTLQGSPRFLRIITTPPIRKILTSTNLDKLGNLVMYESQKEFVSQLKKSLGPKK